MRRVVYRVAASLDGYIAGPKGQIDWIVHDPTIDLASQFAATDTVLLGRRTYELTLQPGAPPWPPNWRVYVFSRTLRAPLGPSVTLIRENIAEAVRALRAASGPDIWLFGGGQLFASLLALNSVDRLELTIVPVLLGGGTPFLGPGASQIPLELAHSQAYPSGIVSLQYDIQHTAPDRR